MERLMIINYPTGLYVDVISDNITWTISSTTPPVAVSKYIQIPVTEQIRPIPGKSHGDERRGSMGALVFSINEATYTEIPSNKKSYGEGDIIEFTDASVLSLDMPSSQRIETRHNTNVLDLRGLGMKEEQVAQLYSSAAKKAKELDVQFSQIRAEVINLEFEIQELQKSINECQKAINVVTLIGDQALLKELEAKLASLQISMTAKSDEYNMKVGESETIKEQINQINQMVK